MFKKRKLGYKLIIEMSKTEIISYCDKYTNCLYYELEEEGYENCYSIENKEKAILKGYLSRRRF